jgi:hypothetical protein
MRGRRAVLCLSGLLVLAAAQAAAQPKPIPTPPIPAPPQLGPVPKIDLGAAPLVPKPDIDIPDAVQLSPMTIPPAPAITEAAKDDTVPPPPSGRETGKPPTVSPGASNRQIQEVLFIVDSGSTQVPTSAEGKIVRVARDMVEDPATRLEVRVFSPSKTHSESAARRLSLARFLAIREILKQNGVSEGRVDGRPLVSEPDELNADRVELYLERAD